MGFFDHKQEQNHDIFKGKWMHYTKQNKPDSERETLHFLSYAESTFIFIYMCVEHENRKEIRRGDVIKGWGSK